MGSKFLSLAVAPLYLAGWALVAGAVVVRSIAKRDKPRQEKGCENPPAGYITRVTGSANGIEVHDCPRHG